ncbi:hypothetical protein J5N97_008205 [Dioscorea zingiberensis]|uniref:Uncharacterized protein n=1 Tax=Dioscorea zingiberensis TaxID=325984 RepID=A0A9D5DE98_9LILI|nr:hypothetical protein J5N97_008205 [Dioscorea zingiberensis]
MSGPAVKVAEAPVKLVEIPGRDRALVATHAIKPGEILIFEPPLLLYPASEVSNYCPLCYRSLSTGGHRCLSGAASSSWLFETIAHLRSHVGDPGLFSQACFLATAYNLVDRLLPSVFSILLSLQGSHTDPSALILHSLLSSLARVPLRTSITWNIEGSKPAKVSETLMRAVKGTVTSARRVSVKKAALIIGRFAEAGAATGARPDVAAYLRRASAAFNELAQVHKKLRDEHRMPRIEINGGGEEEAEKDEKAKKKKKEKRNPSVQQMDEKWRSSDLEGGTGSFDAKGEGFEENRRKKERRELEENGFVLEVGKKKKKKEKKQKNLDWNGVAEEERSDFDGKSEELVVDGKKKKKKKKDKNVDKDSENLEEGAQSEFMESHERRDERELPKKKKVKKRRNYEEDGTGSELDRVGLDGDWKKRKHSDDGVVDERELHKKKKRKTKEQDS